MSRSVPVHEHLHEVHTVEDVLALVREHGGRVTSSRRLLLEALFEGPGHRTAEELAELACFLISDRASHITAQSIAVDGGILGTHITR